MIEKLEVRIPQKRSGNYFIKYIVTHVYIVYNVYMKFERG